MGSKNKPKRRRVARASAPTDADKPTPTPIDARAISRDLSATAAEAAKHLRPSTEDWIKLLQKASVYGSIGVAAWLSRPGPYNSDFELSDDDAIDIVTPPSRLISKSKFNQRWGHYVMQGGEYLDAIRATVAYGAQIQPGVAAKITRQTPPTPTGRKPNVINSRQTARAQQNIEPDTTANGSASARVVSSATELPDEPPAGGWAPTDYTSHTPD